MKLKPLYQNNYINRRMNLYAGSPINNKFNQKKNSLTINNFGRTPKKFFRIKKDKEFNQLLDDYYENYYKFQKKNKHFKKPIKEEENFNFNQFQLKKKNLSVLFFTYDSQKNDELDFKVTDDLIKSMFTGKDDTLIKTTQIQYDYEMRLKVKTNKANSSNKQKIEDFIFLDDGDNIIEENYLDFKNNIYENPKSYLFEEIINSNFNGVYETPIYSIKEKIEHKNEEINELKQFRDIVKQRILFEQVISSVYKNLDNYKPPPIFPKLPEDEEYKESFNFNENPNDKEEEDDNNLILLSNIITNQEFPMFENLIRNDYKGKYSPPIYKIPSDIQKEIEEENERKKKEKEIYEINKKLNVESDINRYENKDLKMLNNIVKENNFPMFEQIINPYYQTNYSPPEVFPKQENLEKVKEEENLGYDDFELDTGNQLKRNDEDENFQLLNNNNQGKELPTLENMIKADNGNNQEEKKETQNNFDENEYNDFE